MAPDSGTQVQGILSRLGLGEQLTRQPGAPPTWTLLRSPAPLQIVCGADLVVVQAQVLPRVGRDDGLVLEALLSGNHRLDGAFFTLEPDGSVHLNHSMPLAGLTDAALDFMIANVARHAGQWDERIAAALEAAATPRGRVGHLLSQLGVPAQVVGEDPPAWRLTRDGAGVTVVATPEFVVLSTRLLESVADLDRARLESLLAASATLRGAVFVVERDGGLTLNHIVPLLGATASTFPFHVGNLAALATEWATRLRGP